MKNHIHIQDNFFDSKFIQTLQKELITLEFKHRFSSFKHINNYDHNYHHVELTEDAPVVQEVTKQLKTHFNFSSIKYMQSSYLLSFPNTPAVPHQDESDFNCLIYLLGNPLINNGTGFYIEQEGNQVLNSHVGFKENRAIFFDAKIYHSPLQFAGNSTPRYIMANFIKV
jgi:hypothetical protein|tara:strand:- start:250 stop:756 length:507 start_codon:yes stop_codon:yes gene_type:complete